MDLDPDLLRLHAAYIAKAREWAEVSLLKATRDGATEPLVLMLDPLDAVARRIADAAGDAADNERAVEEAARRGVYPIFTWGVPRAYAAELLARDLPEVAEAILGPHPFGDGYLIIVVAGGGASPIVMPPLRAADVAEWTGTAGGGPP